MLVVTYWFCATSAEGIGTDLGQHVSARPEATLVAISFVLYCLWDVVGRAIRTSDLYPKSPPGHDVPRRRYVTYACTVLALAFAALIWLVDPRSNWTIVVTDACLIGLILLFRFAKESRFVTPYDAYPVDDSNSKPA